MQQRAPPEKFWKISWDSAPAPVEGDCFISPDEFDILALPGILRRVELCKVQQALHSNKNAQATENGSHKNTTENGNNETSTMSTPNPQPRKKNNKKKSPGQELFSSMIAPEQKMYLELLSIFGGRVCTEVTAEEKVQIEMLALLHGRVVQEQQMNNQRLKETANSRAHLYQKLNPEAHRQLQIRLCDKLEFALKTYSPSYKIDRVLPLVTSRKEPKVNAMTFQHTLLQLGKSGTACLPNLDLGPTVFLPLNPEVLDQRYQSSKSQHSSKKVISSDSIALELAKRHSANIICSSSALQTLLSGLIPPFDRSWELPLLFSGNKEHPVLLIDKALAQAETSSRERNSLFHKYTARIRLSKNHLFPNKTLRKDSSTEKAEHKTPNEAKTSSKRTRSVESVAGNLFELATDLSQLETFGSSQSVTCVLSAKKQVKFDLFDVVLKKALGKGPESNKLSSSGSNTAESTEKHSEIADKDSTLPDCLPDTPESPVKDSNLTMAENFVIPMIPLNPSTSESSQKYSEIADSTLPISLPDTPESPVKAGENNLSVADNFVIPTIPLNPKSTNQQATIKTIKPAEDKHVREVVSGLLSSVSGQLSDTDDSDGMVIDETVGHLGSSEDPLEEHSKDKQKVSYSIETVNIDNRVSSDEPDHTEISAAEKETVENNLQKSGVREQSIVDDENEKGNDLTDNDSDSMVIDETAGVVKDLGSTNNCNEPQVQNNIECTEDTGLFPPIVDPYLHVTYSLLSLGDIRLLVRSKIDAMDEGKPVLIYPKMQYLSNLGLEENSAQELVEQWVKMLIQPSANLARVHIDAVTSQVLKIQEFNGTEQLLSGCNSNKFNPAKFLDQLHQMLSPLTSLSPGQYLLTHKAQECVAHLYRHSSKRCGFDLHGELKQRLLNVKEGCIQTKDISFLPLDPEISLPSLQGCRIPGIFPARKEVKRRRVFAANVKRRISAIRKKF